MNKLSLFLLGLILFPMCMFSQVKTEYADEMPCDINGLKLGYVYTIEQIKAVLGTPTDVGPLRDSEFGKECRVRFGKDFIRYDDGVAGLFAFALRTNKYTLRIYGISFKVGDSIAKFRTHPFYKREEKRENTVLIFLKYDDATPVVVGISDSGVITSISYGISKGI